jgi:uncharacterized protein (TIGR03083 family)
MTDTMNNQVLPTGPLDRRQAATLAETEYGRFLDLVRSLTPDEWSAPTECPGWDVRAMSGHVLGMMDFAASIRDFLHTARHGTRAARGRPLIDGITEVQVAERAHLTVPQLIERMTVMAPRAARGRRTRLRALLRLLPITHVHQGVKETWRLGYLYDTILTRDTWMHRVDICRATGRDPELTAAHDGRLVADVVAEWTRRHGQPYRLTLTGPAGGSFHHGHGGEEITIDAVEYCRIMSGRSSGTGLLTNLVPF